MGSMESALLTTNHQPSILRRLLSAVVPVLFVAISYIDPGKWAATVEGGARFGLDLVTLVLVFNFSAILCQYLSARVALVTGRDLAQICSEEYDRVTCILLGMQAEISLISLDLTMVLGTAHGLNALFGIDLFTSVFLTAINALLFPLFAALIEDSKARLISVCWAGVILFSYSFGVIISQPETQPSMSGMFSIISGESAFALMSLLGANLMPHNFYLHSSIVKQDQGSTEVSKGVLCNDHFFAILFIFSGIFLVNFVLMNSAANVFHSAGLVLLNFQDALSLLDQAFRSSIAPIALMVVIFFSNQIAALTWDLGGQVVVHDLFRMEIPGWLHHATIRIISVIPALYCVWSSGAEGVYQLLIFSQVVVALLLPSSVIPLFRVASSRSILGAYRVSHVIECLALVTFIGMLGLKITFVIEMLFGSSEWVSYLGWNIGNGVPIPYAVLLVTAFFSLCLMLWLAATPLNSASSKLGPETLTWDMQAAVRESSVEGEQNNVSELHHIGEPRQMEEPTIVPEMFLEGHPETLVPNPDINLPDTILDSGSTPLLTTIEENKSEIAFGCPSHSEISATRGEVVPTETDSSEVFGGKSISSDMSNDETVDVVEKTLRVEGDVQIEKDDEGDSWEPEESTKMISESSQSLTSDGPGSFKCISGKTDDVGSGTGSLSRLAGLGRAARRQLTAILDEFWGQLFDFHGQATQEARLKKLDVLLGVDTKADAKSSSVSFKLDSSRKEFSGYLPTGGAKVSDSLINMGSYSSLNQQIGQNDIESPYASQRGSQMWTSTTRAQLIDTYARSSGRNTLDGGERRHSSVHVPATSAGYDQQPATVHGYELASYLSRINKERLQFLKMESPVPKSTSSMPSNYADTYVRGFGQRPQNGMSHLTPPGFSSVSALRNSSLQPRDPYNDICPPETAMTTGNSTTVKKYYSLPDISPHRDSSLSEKSGQWDNSIGYGQPLGHSMHERTCPTSLPRHGAPFGIDEHSPSKVCRDAFSLQFSSNSSTGSLWSRQPFEQFGVADKTRAMDTDQIGTILDSTQETASVIDLEAKLLRSFRICIMKLLKLEGSDWLFRQNDGADEDLIDRVAAREKFLFEAETRETNWLINTGESQFSSERRPGSAPKADDTDYTKLLVTSVPHCGEGCVWRVDLIISFGVWCIHRILELSLMESRPELWGKYTYVLNRLQGIIELAFFKPRMPMPPCFCLQIPLKCQQKSSMHTLNGNLPPPVKQGRGKCTTAAMLLEMIKDVEMAISCRKGRTGTAAGDVAFPRGKENLASVLKRYKRRLSNKPVGSQESGGTVARKVPPLALYGS